MSFFGKIFGSPSSSAAAPGGGGGGGSAAPTNSNLNRMNRNLKGILGAASNVGSSEFKSVFAEFKATAISASSSDFQGRLLQINDSNSLEAIKEIREDINVKIAALNTQFRQLIAKMQRLPPAVFTRINDKYSQTLSDVYANLTATLKMASSKAGKLITKKETESAKFAASFPAVPNASAAPGPSRLPELEARFAALKKMGGSRRRRHVKRKTRKIARRSQSRRKVAA